MVKPKNYYSRFNHFLTLDLRTIESFRVIKHWLKNKRKIVDIGCGIGYLTFFWQAIGIDNDSQAITIARKHFPKNQFITQDITQKLPFKTNSVNALVCYNVLEHLSPAGRQNFFKQAKRVLTKDGLFIAGHIDENYWLNHLLALIIPNYGIKDPTHLVSWTNQDFTQQVSKYFQIVKQKQTSPYGKLIFLTRFLKGELLILAKQKLL